MPRSYRSSAPLSAQIQEELRSAVRRLLTQESITSHEVQQELRRVSKLAGYSLPQDSLIQTYRESAGVEGIPELQTELLQRLRLKPMRSHSGVQTVAVLTKPFPCPGQCIFCPNDIRMPKSYIASEPGAQRAERNSFDPYLQTYSRLEALRNMGHEPSKIELIILGGTWSYYPESYQIWFIHECFRALNEFGEGKDDREAIREQISHSVRTKHRSDNRVVESAAISINGRELEKNYNQIISHYYLEPEISQEGGIEVRREKKSWTELEKQQTRNESSRCRNVGLTIETRPDNISEAEVQRIRRLGCTRAQIGFQSLSDSVLSQNRRGHDVAASRRAVKLLRQAGFKIHAHWMPNLYGSSLEQDKKEFLELFLDSDFQPDELKIYPCALIPSAELMQYYEAGKWKAYTREELSDLLAFCLTKAPEWVRLTRVIRDIPSTEMHIDTIQTNLRQIVQDKLKKSRQQQSDIRSREISKQKPKLPVQLSIQSYKSSVGVEYFLQYVDAENRLIGFLRLTLPSSPSYVEELGANAIIRELHVYGQVEAVGIAGNSATQHKGFGKLLLNAAEKLAFENGYQAISVISAVGTREYYRKQGFSDGVRYQHKVLQRNNLQGK